MFGYDAEKGPKFNPFFIPKMIADIAAGHISMMYGFHGPNFATVSACASSTNALIDAFNYVRLGMADMIVSGGAEAPISIAGEADSTPCTPSRHGTMMPSMPAGLSVPVATVCHG